MSEICFPLTAFDDEAVEDEETFTLVIDVLKPNDAVDGNTTIVVFDNDGNNGL